ncbi:hypothetical protein, partial [Planococcus chinensis]|uniref:hypothetical protein n=1 Tax=Planococcus chinensis TaxID=272917 RepID=UPI001CC7EDF2
HVLGTPPAFVLSQDQTLHYREPIAQILLASRRSEERASRLIWPKPDQYILRGPFCAAVAIC